MTDAGFIPALVQAAAGGTIAISGIRLAGHNHKSSTLWEHAAAVSLIVTGCFVLWATARSASPVQTNVSYEVVRRENGIATLSIYGTKARPECRLLGGDAYIHVHDEIAPIRKAGTQWPRDSRPGASRPAGPQSFGEWEVSFPEPPAPYAVSFVLHHQCGKWLGLTQSQIGPFAIQRPPG